MRDACDTLITIPNDRLLQQEDKTISINDAFSKADEVLFNGVQGITDLISTPGLINVDFADVKSVLADSGAALMGIGRASGNDRASKATDAAINSPLLEYSMEGAKGVLLSIAGGSDLGLFEANEAASIVREKAHPDANIIFGTVIDDSLGDEVRVTVVAAGFEGGEPPARVFDNGTAKDEESFEEAAEKSSGMSIRQRATRVSDEDDIDIPPFMR